MVESARKRRRDEIEDVGPGNKRDRPSPGDGDKTSSEHTTSSTAKPASDTSYNLVSSIESTVSPIEAPRNLPKGPTTLTQSIASSFAGLISPFTTTHPAPTIAPSFAGPSHSSTKADPAPTTASSPALPTSDQNFGKGAGLIRPYSASSPPPHLEPPVSPSPKRGRKRRQRATTPPETYTNNLPLVTIVPPIPERPPTGYRRGHAYWLINGVTRLTLPIINSVDALLEAETRDQEALATWNTTLEEAVKGVAWRDMLGVPPAHVSRYLAKHYPVVRETDSEEAETEIETEGEGDVDSDDGEAVGGGLVGGGSYVDASFPADVVAGSLIDVGDVAQNEGPAPATNGTPVVQAGGHSEEPGQVSGEVEKESGQASGEVEREPGAVAKNGLVMECGRAPDVEPPRDLPGWVNYEERLVDPKYF